MGRIIDLTTADLNGWKVLALAKIKKKATRKTRR